VPLSPGVLLSQCILYVFWLTFVSTHAYFDHKIQFNSGCVEITQPSRLHYNYWLLMHRKSSQTCRRRVLCIVQYDNITHQLYLCPYILGENAHACAFGLRMDKLTWDAHKFHRITCLIFMKLFIKYFNSKNL